MALAPPAQQQTQIIRATPPPPDGRTAPADQPRPNPRVGRLRSWMLALVASAVAFGALAAVIAFQANQATYDAYSRIVDEGSVSVDAALRARAAALDHMTDAATYLETSGDVQQQAAARANEHWAEFSEESRVSWGNLSDPMHGENSVFQAADRAARDYIQQIGSMFAFEQAGQADRAGDAFLAAREIMNTRLVPALTGLEAVKVELMEDTYAGAAEEIAGWRVALIGALGVVVGMRIGFAATLVLAALTLIVVARMNLPVLATRPMRMRGVWRTFDPALRRLLLSDVVIRTCEGMAGVFVILYVTTVRGFSVPAFSLLLALQVATSLVVYLPAAQLADRIGRRRRGGRLPRGRGGDPGRRPAAHRRSAVFKRQPTLFRRREDDLRLPAEPEEVSHHQVPTFLGNANRFYLLTAITWAAKGTTKALPCA